jgi:hypothetical protein
MINHTALRAVVRNGEKPFNLVTPADLLDQRTRDRGLETRALTLRHDQPTELLGPAAETLNEVLPRLGRKWTCEEIADLLD